MGFFLMIYAFFRPDVEISYVEGRHVHDFTCAAKQCKGKGKSPRLVRYYLDTGDKKSTSGLRRHAVICWGEEIVKEAAAAKDIVSARDALKGAVQRDGSITAVFERTKKGKLTYSYRQHMKAETRWFISIKVTWKQRAKGKLIGLKLPSGSPKASAHLASSKTMVSKA